MTIMENEVKEMTMREFLNYIANADGIREDIKEKANKEIAKLDKKNAERNGKMSKADKEKQIENENIKNQIVKLFDNNENKILIASEISEKIGFSTQKISSLCIQLVKNEILKSKEIKIKGKGKVKGYMIF